MCVCKKGLTPEYEEQIRLLKAEIRALTSKNKDLAEVEVFLRKELDKKQELSNSSRKNCVRSCPKTRFFRMRCMSFASK